jgi:putative membrane protein
MQWWCVAGQAAWTWTWRPLPGVWLFVLGLYGAHRVVNRRWTDEAETHRAGRRRFAAFAGAAFLIWASLDWPLGPLGASYLASIHMLQFILVGVAAPALLLLSVPPAAFRALGKSRAFPLIRGVTHPLSAFMIFNFAMTISNWPGVVDTLMGTQLGSFALDLSWILAGLLFWYPVIVAFPHGERFAPIYKIGYLALNAFLIRPPFAMMIFSESPIYGIYELAPPLGGVDPLADQQLGGAIMKIGTAWIMAIGVIVVFRGWFRQAQAAGET